MPEQGSNTRSPTFQAGSFNHSTSPPPPASQQTQNICMPFVQRRSNVFNVGPTLYKCFVFVGLRYTCDANVLLEQYIRIYACTLIIIIADFEIGVVYQILETIPTNT